MFSKSFVVFTPLRVNLTLTSILYPFEFLRSFALLDYNVYNWSLTCISYPFEVLRLFAAFRPSWVFDLYGYLIPFWVFDVAQWARADSKCAKNQNWWIWNFQFVSLVLGKNSLKNVIQSIITFSIGFISVVQAWEQSKSAVILWKHVKAQILKNDFFKKKAFNLTLDTLHAHCQANQTTQRTIMRPLLTRRNWGLIWWKNFKKNIFGKN